MSQHKFMLKEREKSKYTESGKYFLSKYVDPPSRMARPANTH